jgi:hypothetical protein
VRADTGGAALIDHPAANAFEALTSILATKGVESVKAWARADGSDAARLSAAATLLMTDTAIRMLTEYAKAKRAGDDRELRRLSRRLDRLLGPDAAHGGSNSPAYSASLSCS